MTNEKTLFIIDNFDVPSLVLQRSGTESDFNHFPVKGTHINNVPHVILVIKQQKYPSNHVGN